MAADVVRSASETRRSIARSRRRRDDVWIGATALVASLLALPGAASSWHGPEVAAVLAVSATALLAGQRWAIAVIAIAELLLVPTLGPRAFLDGGTLAMRVVPLLSLLAIVPGVLALRRAAAALVLMTGRRRTGATCRRVHALLVAGAVVGIVVPLLT